jgi:hypothetical protein
VFVTCLPRPLRAAVPRRAGVAAPSAAPCATARATARTTALVAALAALAGVARAQGPVAEPAPSSLLPPSPVARLEITPAGGRIVAGDSTRLTVRALDAQGRPVPEALVRYTATGGHFEGTVDSTGMVVAGSVGKLPIAVVALVPGTRPFIRPVTLEFVPAPAARVEVRTPLATLVAGQQLRVEAVPFSRVNDRAAEPVRWASGAPAVVRVTGEHLVTAVAPGRAVLTATAGAARAEVVVRVVAAGGRAELAPTPPSVRQGDVVRFAATYRDAAGRPVAGVTPTFTFAPGDGRLEADGRFVAYRPGEYQVTASFGPGAQATTVVRVAERAAKRPVEVVSRLPRTQFPTSEVWIHPNGQVAYLGTHGGGDRVYAIDIANPAAPRVVDSIVVNARVINDMVTSADGRWLVLTREGAADRKNGIVVADVSDPLHPRQVADFTDGVTGGVHSLYMYEHPTFGRHVFLTNDGTGAVDVVNLDDPSKPRRAGEFRTARPDAARTVHDLDLVDGLLYASYWNDGLVILDVGNGIRGGTPTKPVLVSQYKYDLDSLYREVEEVSSAGFIRGTHTAWRQRGGKYVFVADEVFRNGNVKGAKDASAGRAYGTLQVLDVSDIAHPKAVAWYTPDNGGVHNVWAVGDTLYVGAYDAGFQVLDVSGELAGDLKAQGRLVASLNTADMDGHVKNAAFTWGVVVNPKDGLAYVNDFNNGLWVVRVLPRKNDKVIQ